jgi:hypothetical protein
MLSNLRTALAVRNLRQVDLAIHTLKIPPSVLSEIIRGRRKASTELRRKIAESLDADEHWLFEPVAEIPKGRAGEASASDVVPGHRGARRSMGRAGGRLPEVQAPLANR